MVLDYYECVICVNHKFGDFHCKNRQVDDFSPKISNLVIFSQKLPEMADYTHHFVNFSITFDFWALKIIAKAKSHIFHSSQHA